MSEPKYINADDAIRHIKDDLTLPEERNDAIFSAQWFINFLEAFPAAPVAPAYTADLQRWVNNRVIFKKCRDFKDYRRGKMKNPYEEVQP